MTSITYATGQSDEKIYGYDKNSNLTSYTNRNGDVISYTYDALNRLESETIGTDVITYSYDIASRLVKVNDNGDITLFKTDTDRLGRLKEVVDSQSNSVKYDYDILSRPTKLTYPDATLFYITYDYDEMSRLTDIKDQSGNVIAHYAYDELSRRTDMYYNLDADATYNEAGIDSHVIYDYEDDPLITPADNDLGNRLGGVYNDINNDGTDDLTFDYTYDKVGNSLSMTVDGSDVHNYDYDNIYQLTDADYPATYSFYDALFNYDNLGNRLDVTENSIKTNYVSSGNSLNQYDSSGIDPSTTDVDYTYDNNGNLTYDGVYTYGYDAENRLITVDDTGGAVATYAYDFAGRRISKTVYGSPDVTTTYCYDGDQVIAEYDDSVTQGTFALVRKFIYGPGIDEPVAMIDVASDEYYWYHFDALGNVIALVDNTATAVATYEYDVYGNATPSGDEHDNPYRFTGRRWDAESSLYYYRARMYNAEIGRFLQPDPIGYYDSMNLYQYCGNSPVNWTDPYGESWRDIADWFINVFGNLCPGNVIASGGGAVIGVGVLSELEAKKRARQNAQYPEGTEHDPTPYIYDPVTRTYRDNPQYVPPADPNDVPEEDEDDEEVCDPDE